MGTYTGQDKRLQYLFQHGGGGGGTTVIANPAGAATDDLTKIQIENTIYNVLGGGGSGGAGYKEVSLWSGSVTATGDIALSDSISLFDYVIVRWSTHKTNTAYYNRELLILVSDIDFNMPASLFAQFADAWYYDGTHWANMSCGFKDATTFTLAEKSAGNMSGVTILEIVGVKIEGSVIELADCFSTEERQIGCYLNGKPLYQKSFDLGSDVTIIGNGWTQIASIVMSAYSIEKIVKGLTQSSTKEYIGALNYSGNTNDTLYLFNPRNAAFTIRYITLQYTKTTDTAGSGIWTPNGSYAHHYTASEQIIGTYLGQTLYEKTFTTNPVSVPSNGNSTVNLSDYGISNVDKIIAIEGRNDTLGTPLPYIAMSSGTRYEITVASSNATSLIISRTGGAISNQVFTLTLQYTKTV